MNDEFLTRFLEEPRPEFAHALYERISQGRQPRVPGTMATKLTFRNAAVAFLFMLFVAACVYIVVDKRWDKVGVIHVDVQKTLKVEINPEEPLVMEFQPRCFSIEEAREVLPFRVKVPAWAPAGFTLSDEMCAPDLSPSSDYAFLTWEGVDKNKAISATVHTLKVFNMATQKYEIGPASTGVMGMPVPPGSYEEVQVHGQPAVLVRGDWQDPPWATTGVYEHKEYEYKWDQELALQLYWVDGEVFYRLYTRADVSLEDLIKMAESAQ